MRHIVVAALSSVLVLQVSSVQAGAGQFGVAAEIQMATGTITGTAQTSAGKVLPGYTVQLRDLQTGQPAGSTTSDARGSFSFASLEPGNYVVEVVSATGAIVAVGAPITLAAGATVPVVVTATLTTAAGVSTALLVTAVALAAGIPGVILLVRDNPSPSR